MVQMAWAWRSDRSELLMMHHAEVETLTPCDATLSDPHRLKYVFRRVCLFYLHKYLVLSCNCLVFPQVTPKLILQKPPKAPQESRKMRTRNGHVSILVQVVNANEESPCLVSLSVLLTRPKLKIRRETQARRWVWTWIFQKMRKP